jgi:threonine dehydrogenase-like Zn-dependent dehydrogenase
MHNPLALLGTEQAGELTLQCFSGDDCTALIVGVGRGGRQCAAILKSRGYPLLCADHDSSRLREVSAKFGATPLFVDVESTASVHIFLRQLANQHPLPHVIVNAAGRSYVRALGMVRVTLGLAPLIEARGEPGLVVNVASSKDDQVIAYSGSTSGFASIAASLEAHLKGSSLSLATCMSDSVDDLFAAMPSWRCLDDCTTFREAS